jgi:hypothetical protein
MTVRSDLDQASSAIERAIAINANHETERLKLIDALNKAIVVIGVFTIFGLAVMHGAEQSRKFVLDRQEQEHVASK